MRYAVLLAREAEDDLVDIYRYVAAVDSVARADELLIALERACRGLARLPHRGHVPPELETIGVVDFREVRFKPYRIVYEILRRAVYVHAVLDGRRELQELLVRRLLR